MERFVIAAKARFGGRAVVVGEILGQERALAEAHRVYRDGTMNKVIVINEELRQVFMIQRRCNCTNVNQELVIIDGITQVVEKCTACGLIINHTGHLKREEVLV